MKQRGSKPGERRGGRAKGTPNKVTADVRALAQEHGPDAIRVLAGIMNNAEGDARARIAACKELLDRAYGKAPQPLSVSPENFAEVFGQVLGALPG